MPVELVVITRVPMEVMTVVETLAFGGSAPEPSELSEDAAESAAPLAGLVGVERDD